jgi:hypothetical protein
MDYQRTTFVLRFLNESSTKYHDIYPLDPLYTDIFKITNDIHVMRLNSLEVWSLNTRIVPILRDDDNDNDDDDDDDDDICMEVR